MTLSPENEPNVFVKRLVIAAVVGLATILSFGWSIIAILASISISRPGDDESSAVFQIILPSAFFLTGLYCAVRFVPGMFSYLKREWCGCYEITSTAEGLSIIPHYGDKKVFLWNDIETIHLNKNLIACSALSILLKNGTGWTFGNLYSEESLRRLRCTLLESKEERLTGEPAGGNETSNFLDYE